MKNTIGILAICLSSMNAAWAEQPNYSHDALRILIDAEPLADLTTDQTQKKLQRIDQEIAGVKAKVLTELGAQVYFTNKLPYVSGEVLVKFNAPANTVLESLFAGGTTLNLSGKSTGITKFDELNQKFSAVELRKGRFSSSVYTLVVASNQNMLLVAKSYDDLSETEFAEANRYAAIGVSKTLRRYGGERVIALYLLTIGWGDCPAGCMAQHRFYYEVAIRPSGAEVAKVGESGHPLEPSVKAQLFQD